MTITIVDNGIGLPGHDRDLTEPYVTTRGRGTGLGLAIVKKIMEDHAGSITLMDSPETGGAKVVGEFPVTNNPVPHEDGDNEQSGKLAEGTGGSVVDDEADIRAIDRRYPVRRRLRDQAGQGCRWRTRSHFGRANLPSLCSTSGSRERIDGLAVLRKSSAIAPTCRSS